MLGSASIAALSAATGSGGSYPITITATNASGSVNQSFTLSNTEAPSITSPGTATFSTGAAGSYTVTTTGYPAPSITLAAGTLPDGLSLSSGGVLSGTPTAGGAITFTVTATDSSTGTGTPYSASRSYTIAVNTTSLTVGPTSLPL